MRSFTTRYGISIALIAGAICFGGLSLAQQPPPATAVQPVNTNPPHGIQVDPHPVVIGGPVGSPTYVLPPGASVPVPPPAPVQKGGFINLGQIFGPVVEPYVDELVNALVAAAVGWLCLLYTRVTGKQVEQHDRDAYTRMLQNEAGSLLADGKVQLMKTVDGIKIHVDSDALANAANHGLTKIADAQKNFGITPEAAAKRIVDMIPQLPTGAALIAQAQPTKPPAAASAAAPLALTKA